MTIVDEFREDESRVLDRLADGELSQQDRRELLVALDQEPEGWRRCALAFLEAQSWRWQLTQVAAEPIVAQATVDGRRNTLGSGTNRGRFWGLCLAAAASVLVAFGLGTRFPTNGEPPVAAPTDASVTVNSEKANWGADPPLQADGIEALVAGETPESTDEASWETLTLALADDAGNVDPNSQFEVRVRNVDAENVSLDELLSGGQSTLSAALVNQLEQEGWTVTRQRRLLPVDLSDGRRMIVPIEQVDIRPPESAQL